MPAAGLLKKGLRGRGFATSRSICSGHPLLIPPIKKLYGIPVYWPKPLKPEKEKLKKLKLQAREVRKQLTYRYNQFIRNSNYNLPAIETDVLQKCIRAIRQRYPQALFIAESGARRDQIADLPQEQLIVKDFIPQHALVPHVDLLLHHGECSAFRESLYHEKPMIVFPFCGDQFHIAYDIEKQELGKVFDPNHFTEPQLQKSVLEALEEKFSWNLHYWSQKIKHTAPAAAILE